ncbi:hypothetical protein LUB17_13305, partial [Enterococcus lactis]|nr:hypothetical protein [Enterococcus lactis]
IIDTVRDFILYLKLCNRTLESVREYGKSMLGNRIKKGASDEELPIELSYKGQIIMGITIQSVFWYKEKRNQISREEIIELYTQTLEKFS